MTFIDTHCHLYDEAFDADRPQAVQRAVDAGVTTMLLPDIDSSSTESLDTLYNQYPIVFRRMTGLHPTSVKEDFEAELTHVRKRLETEKFVAVGEIGMDLYWDRTYEEQQREVFRRQMLWAEEYTLPVALHIRKAHNEVFGLLRDLNRSNYRGVMHCFGGSLQEAWKAVEMGFMLGIGGVVTFKNATMAEVAKAVPLDRLQEQIARYDFMVLMLWLMLRREDPQLKKEKFEGWLETMGVRGVLTTLLEPITQAVAAAFPESEDEDADEDDAADSEMDPTV